MNIRVVSAAMIGLATPTLGLLALPPASAQQLFDVGVRQLQPGTIIPVQTLEGGEPQYFSPNSTHPLTLRVAQDIYGGNGQLVIPAGAKCGVVCAQFREELGSSARPWLSMDAFTLCRCLLT